jgi:rRNA-processing protein FCF1
VSKRRFASLDTSFLLALAEGEEDCEAVIDWLGRINVYPLVTPTVIQELMDIEEQDREACPTAKAAKEGISVWGILDAPLSPTDHGIAEIIASKLIAKGVLADECLNDGLVLAEAGIQECKLLLTYRSTILEASFEAMKLVLLESDVSDVFAVGPPDVVAYLAKANE